MTTAKRTSGNPILPGRGVCDPQIRIYNDRDYLYDTHDRSPESKGFAMDDWWIWSSPDLVNWQHECTIRPEDTYYGQPDSSCWAADAMERNGKHYFYFSRGPKNIGVMAGDSPVGPWRDLLGKPLLADGDVPTAIRDPGLFKDDDGTCYIVFGTSYYVEISPAAVVDQLGNPFAGISGNTTYHFTTAVFYDQWIAAYPTVGNQTAFGDDPDGDGLANGLEAWFGTRPDQITPGLKPVGCHGNTFTFTHPVNPNAPASAQGSYEWSPNLIDWYPGDGLAGPPGGPMTIITSQIAGGTATTSRNVT